MILELRQYTLRAGQRDTLIELFERQFIEPQEAEGMQVVGTFRDLDRPNRFVWLRGFRDMHSRAAGLAAFYEGPVWQAHREAANATMVDSDNVLLLRGAGGAKFDLSESRPKPGEDRPHGLILASIHHVIAPPAEAAQIFEAEVKPRLEKAGAAPIAWFVTETAANNFPRLPVREGEKVLVWFARLQGAGGYARRKAAIGAAAAALAPLAAASSEVLRLEPTVRSLLR